MLAHRPRYLSTLRGLIDDPSSSIRDSAIEVLAMNQDEYVQRRLIEGLEDPNEADHGTGEGRAAAVL